MPLSPKASFLELGVLKKEHLARLEKPHSGGGFCIEILRSGHGRQVRFRKSS